MSRKNSVEFQIFESDVMNKLQGEGKENLMKLAKELFALGEEDLDLGITIIGLKTVLKADHEELMAIATALLITKKSCPEEYEIITKVLAPLLVRKLKDEIGEEDEHEEDETN